ncbi:MAG: hypothetical protein IBJ15_02150 [Alphaproteobacteria bacterium]|nr:hypothetical protein [Alphaproteobacteria bacterium]
MVAISDRKLKFTYLAADLSQLKRLVRIDKLKRFLWACAFRRYDSPLLDGSLCNGSIPFRRASTSGAKALGAERDAGKT